MHINNINGKVYVGITHHANPNRRWGYSGQKYTHCKKFLNAINKYGWENFDHIIICRTSKEKAIVLETSLIAYYKKLNMSYNLSDGGDGAESITEENRRAISKRMRENHPMKGKHHTPEARAKISEAGKKRIYTEKQKEQIRAAGEIGRQTMRNRGWVFTEDGKKNLIEKHSFPVIQLDITGNILNRYSSASEADRVMSNGKGHHISDVCNGKRKTAYGYMWKYEQKGGVDGL
jgi:group I intron endonuclease